MVASTAPDNVLDAPTTRRSAAPREAHHDNATIHEARALVADLFVARPAVYWFDLLVTLAIGYGAAAAYFRLPFGSPLQIGAFFVCGFAFFRAGSYVHEITHMRSGQMLSFRVAWNLLCGIPLVMPSHFYENHLDHHNSHHYGTERDGEYVPLGGGGWGEILKFFAQVPFMPLYIALRLLLSPLTFAHPKVRTWVLEHMSSYVLNFHHRLTIPKNAPRRVWAALELACSLRLAGMLAVVALGMFPVTRLVLMYCLATFVLALNYLRNLVAHRYRNDGKTMSHAEQLADSITITGHPLLTELFFPLGLRYHALHHLFPGIPYHNLAKAHRRLMAGLSPDSLYCQTVYPSFRAAVRQLWDDAQPANLEPARSAI